MTVTQRLDKTDPLAEALADLDALMAEAERAILGVLDEYEDFISDVPGGEKNDDGSD